MDGLTLLLLGAGAYFLFGGSATAPVFKDATGKVITSILCGGSYSFDVPGRTHVWLHQTKDGAQQYDGPFQLPMPLYTSNCVNDVGVYHTTVYELAGTAAAPAPGALIGSTVMTIGAS